MAYYISKLKWVWQGQFLSPIIIILKNNVFFEEKQMILLPLFDIYTGLDLQKTSIAAVSSSGVILALCHRPVCYGCHA